MRVLLTGFEPFGGAQTVATFSSSNGAHMGLAIEPTGKIDSVSAIENVVVSTASSGALVYLRDIASVRRAYREPPSLLVRYNGRPAIALGVSNVTGANVVEMGQAIVSAITVFVMSVLAAVYPSIRAARLKILKAIYHV